MDKRKLYLLFFFLAAVLFLDFISLSYPCVPLTTVKISKLTAAAFSDGAMVAVDKLGDRLFVTNKENKVVFVCNTAKLSHVPDTIVDVATDGKYIYIAGHDTDGGIYCTKEHIEQYDMRGKYVRNVYCEEIAKNRQVIDRSIMSADVYKGKLYVVHAAPSGYEVTVRCYDGENARDIYTVKSDFKIEYANYNAEYGRMSLTDILNKPYIADGSGTVQMADVADFFGDRDTMNIVLPAFATENAITYLVFSKCSCVPVRGTGKDRYAFAYGLADSISFCDITKESEAKAVKIGKLPCSAMMIACSSLCFVALAWMVLSVLYGIWRFFAGLSAEQKKKARFAGIVFLAVVGLIIYYSYNIKNILIEQYKAKTYALSHIAAHDIGHLMPEFMTHLKEHGVQGYLAYPVHQGELERTIQHFNNLCADSGEQDRFYIRLAIADANGSLINYIDTTKDYPCGLAMSAETQRHNLDAIKGDSWSRGTTARGETVAFFRPVYDENNMFAGIVETGCYSERVRKVALRESLMLLVTLSALLVYLIPMLFYVFREKGWKAGL